MIYTVYCYLVIFSFTFYIFPVELHLYSVIMFSLVKKKKKKRKKGRKGRKGKKKRKKEREREREREREKSHIINQAISHTLIKTLCEQQN